MPLITPRRNLPANPQFCIKASCLDGSRSVIIYAPSRKFACDTLKKHFHPTQLLGGRRITLLESIFYPAQLRMLDIFFPLTSSITGQELTSLANPRNCCRAFFCMMRLMFFAPAIFFLDLITSYFRMIGAFFGSFLSLFERCDIGSCRLASNTTEIELKELAIKSARKLPQENSNLLRTLAAIENICADRKILLEETMMATGETRHYKVFTSDYSPWRHPEDS